MCVCVCVSYAVGHNGFELMTVFLPQLPERMQLQNYRHEPSYLAQNWVF